MRNERKILRFFPQKLRKSFANGNPSFKPPKISTDTWSGKSYDSVLNGFTLTGCADKVKLTLTLQAILMDKKGPLNNITDWDEFKTKLIKEYGSIDIFGREVNQIFDLLPYYESVQEVAEDLSPKIKKLQSDLIIISSMTRKTSIVLPSLITSTRTS